MNSNDKKWLFDYYERYKKAFFEAQVGDWLVELRNLFLRTHKTGKKVIFIGNGGSAAMASHCAVDFTKNAGVRSINFNETDLLTCLSNDFDYRRCFQKALQYYADAGDVVVLISSSGTSPNILEAASFAKETGLSLVTLTGFSGDNPLSTMGDINLSVDSRAYNIIENIHQIWLLTVCDMIIGKAEYSASSS